MKILDRTGKLTTLDQATLDAFDQEARKVLTRSKRRKDIRVEGDKVYLKVYLKGALTHEQRELLRTVINLRTHGKAYAPEEVDRDVEELHFMVSRGLGLALPIVFDLSTGAYTVEGLGGN